MINVCCLISCPSSNVRMFTVNTNILKVYSIIHRQFAMHDQNVAIPSHISVKEITHGGFGN